MKNKVIIYCYLILVFVTAILSVHAAFAGVVSGEVIMDTATVRVIDQNELMVTVKVKGDIDVGTPSELRQVLSSVYVANSEAKIVVLLNSNGGYVIKGFEIAHIIKAYGANTHIATGDKCYSACTIAFLGGKTRTNSGRLGYHNAWYSPSAITCTPDQLVWEFVTGQAYSLKVFNMMSGFIETKHLREFIYFYSEIKNVSYSIGNKIVILSQEKCVKSGICTKRISTLKKDVLI